MILKKGEKRFVGIEIYSYDESTPFTIENAEYILSHNEIGHPEAVVDEKGNCTINGHKIMAMYEAKSKGRFNMSFIYEIAGERFIHDVSIDVN